MEARVEREDARGGASGHRCDGRYERSEGEPAGEGLAVVLTTVWPSLRRSRSGALALRARKAHLQSSTAEDLKSR